MKLTRTMLAASAVPLALAMAGCSHSGTSGPGAGVSLVAGDVIAQAQGDTASNALNDGNTLKADATTVDAVALNFADDTAAKTKATGFALKKNVDGGVDMTVNGKTVSFSSNDMSSPDDWEKTDSGYHSLSNFTSDSATAAIDGSDQNYFQVWGYYTDDGAGSATEGFAVVGAETAPSVIKSHANATYVGEARAETKLASDLNEQTTVKGTLTLNADFQDGSVKGSIDNLKGRTKGADTGGVWTLYQDAVAGTSIEMTKAQISANGFAGGKLVAHDPGGDIGSLDGSTYSGRFYGPDADQVAGTLSIKGTGDDGKFVGTGFFAGNKQ